MGKGLPAQCVDEFKMYIDPYEISCAFNMYFVNIRTLLLQQIGPSKGYPLDYLNKIFFHPSHTLTLQVSVKLL